jgi:hypothetical protein
MRPGTPQIRWLAVRFGGMAFLLAMAMLAGAALAQDAVKPPPSKDQRKQAKSKDESPKKDAAPKKAEPKTAPAKLGLSVNDPRALQGYTLMSPFVSPNTYLLDMQGRVVHMWKTDSSPALSAVLLENGHLLRPGSIGGDAGVFGPGPGVGGRIQEFTWDGELVWDFNFYNAKQLPHHDLTRLPNGNVLMVVWDRKTTEETIAAGRRPQMTGDQHFLPDSLVEIKPTGKTTGEVVWEWHLWDHLVQDFDKTKMNFGNVAMHPELVNINYGEDDLPFVIAAKAGKDKGDKDKDGKVKEGKDKAKAAPTPPANNLFRVNPDFTHCNGVAYNADLDQIAVSVWKFSEFWIIDHSTTTAEAAGHQGGRGGKGGDLLYRWGNPWAYRAGTKADKKLFSQHNAHWIPKGLAGAGHILLFNNGVERPGGNHSSVDELELPVDSLGRYLVKPGAACGPDQPVWSYTAPKKNDFFSSFISGAQRLANGNTLICSGANGTIFEVTPEKEIVWKYVNPVKFGTPFGPQPPLGRIMSPVAGDMLAISPEQRKRLDEIQKDIDAHLDRLFSAEQKKQVAERATGAGSPYSPRPQPGKVMTDAEQNRLKLTDDQKKDMAALQKTVDSRLEKVLTAAQKKQLKSVFSPPAPALVAAGNMVGRFVQNVFNLAGPPQAKPATAIAEPSQPGKILSAGQQDLLKLSSEQKKRLTEIQKDIDTKLETLLTEDQKKQLQAMQPKSAGAKTTVAAGPTGPDRISGSPLFRAYRYGNDYPAFTGKKLTAGQPLEDMQSKELEKKVSKN